MYKTLRCSSMEGRGVYYVYRREEMDLSYYRGPLYRHHLPHHFTPQEEEMDQPLDLSQREPDLSEPICQFTNCSCSRKHILSLDGTESTYRPPMDQSPKRSPEHIDTSGHFHPKRRKIDQYNKNISRSSSDTNLYEYGSASTSSYRPYLPYSDENVSLSQRNSPDQYWKTSQSYTPPSTYRETDTVTTETMSKHIERLPKKRSHARNLSYETNYNQPMPATEVKSSRTPSPQDKMVDGGPSQRPMIIDAEPSQGPFIQNKHVPEMVLPELNCGHEVKGDELRASIMKEIHENQDDEDIDEFRRRFFGSLFKRAKATTNSKPSPLDILISDKCKSELNFRPKNSHIDQILRGEKQGKLCLMDIVELQVEIGLA